MLKIRDGVDLKELEKFGYKQDVPMSFSYHKNNYFEQYEVFVDSATRQIHEVYHTPMRCEMKNLKYIDDLIKADLVEKVDE